MILAGFLRKQGHVLGREPVWGMLLLASVVLADGRIARSDTVNEKEKRVIGATAVISEESTGFSFPARIDTGAKSCSLHVEKIEIEDKASKRLENVGKPIRFLVKNGNGETEWIETQIAAAVRIRTAAAQRFDHRYKVRLTLRWRDFAKEVLVTLNDREDMAYPLLIGRNFLRGDFLVDVEQVGD